MTDVISNPEWAEDPYVVAHPFALSFWDAAARGELVLPTCMRCGKPHWYPRPFCPHCESVDVTWRAASGRGRVYTLTHLRRSEKPYVLAYVQLEEGPKVLTNLVGAGSTLKIGDAVVVCFEQDSGGRTVPFFRREQEPEPLHHPGPKSRLKN